MSWLKKLMPSGIRTDAGAAQMVERLLGRMKPGRNVARVAREGGR